jgi:hypothetical protein
MSKAEHITFFILPVFLFLSAFAAAQEKEPEQFTGKNKTGFDSIEKWSYHFQLTSIGQGHGRFHSAYSGQNSLRDTDEVALSLTSTLFLGRKLWKGAAVFFNPELAGGKGISYALGLAGAANGETFRVGNPEPKIYVARAFFQQHIALKNSEKEYEESDLNQLGNYIPASRVTINAGKFSIADFYDDNAYSHDPRSDFFNWSLMSNGAWDYPANTRGYTWGLMTEIIKPSWSLRLSSVLMPVKANGNVFDLNVEQSHAETIEFEKKLKIKNHPGGIRILGFENFSSSPFYSNAIAQMQAGDSSLVQVLSGKIPGQDYGRMKYGFALSAWQELTKNLGVFARAGWNDGKTGTWAFTEIDETVSAGISLKGREFNRSEDVIGIACVMNGISKLHAQYLNAGGYGFMLGDGKLTHYNNEIITEAFYKIKLASSLWITPDYQLVLNPGYNANRGPVSIYALRAHVQL